MIINSRLFTCFYFKRWGWNVLCCIKCALGIHKLLASEWEKVGNVVCEETQESATGLYSLTRRMWCESNMKTDELSHVQRCFALPASGQQAWIKHVEGRALEENEDRGSPFLSRLADTPRQPFETYDDIKLAKKSRLTSCLILSFKTPLLELVRHGASLNAGYSSFAGFF